MDLKRDFDAFQGGGWSNSSAIKTDDNAERRKISQKGAFYILCQHRLVSIQKNSHPCHLYLMAKIIESPIAKSVTLPEGSEMAPRRKEND